MLLARACVLAGEIYRGVGCWYDGHGFFGVHLQGCADELAVKGGLRDVL